MSLTPESRVLLTDALRPPAGYRLDVAVGTTYSLNLTALLLAPLSFALFEVDSAERLERVDPIRLLEAARRYADRTTVFCQAGGIHVPSNYRSILTFVEDSVLEVVPPHEGSIFHPKIWALRFVDQDSAHLHRVVILSRNMTLDRSWDTALSLDEDPEGVISAAPAASFVADLPALAVRALAPERAGEIADLARTLGRVSLAPPAPFTGGELLPIGLSDKRVWPFPREAKRLLAISPFLTRSAIRSIGKVSPSRVLLSRAEALDLLGAQAVEGWDVNVLQRAAEGVVGDDIEAGIATDVDGFREAHDGLHAKTFILDLPGGESTVVTGSANLTSATWGTNVEFDATLVGPTRECGVDAVLNGAPDAPGLAQLLQNYTPTTAEGLPDPAFDTSKILEAFHQQLAVAGPILDVTRTEEDASTVTLTVEIPRDLPGKTLVWPASLPRDAHAKPLGSPLSWTLSPRNITPFVAVETTAGEGDARVTRQCTIRASLTGAVDSRRSDAVFDILRSKEDVLRYLVLLLGDPSYETLFAQAAGSGGERYVGSDNSVTSVDIALFEPLVRAVGRDEDALARVASLVEELRALPRGDGLVPDGFEHLWGVVWGVHQEQRR